MTAAVAVAVAVTYSATPSSPPALRSHVLERFLVFFPNIASASSTLVIATEYFWICCEARGLFYFRGAAWQRYQLGLTLTIVVLIAVPTYFVSDILTSGQKIVKNDQFDGHISGFNFFDGSDYTDTSWYELQTVERWMVYTQRAVWLYAARIAPAMQPM